MPDETYRLEIQDNLADVKQRADAAKQAVKDLLDEQSRGAHTFPEPGKTIPLNELKDSVEKISAAQDRWAMSTMNHAERVAYLTTKVNQQVEGTDAWYNAQAQLNGELKKSDDSMAMIAKNFTPLIGAGRALTGLARAGSIFGNLIGDDDLVRVSQMTMGVGQLVMVAGRLPQVATTLGLSMGALGAAGLGVGAIAALSQLTHQTTARTAAGPWGFSLESGAEAGKETREWLHSIGVELPNLSDAINKATTGTEKLDDVTNSAADALLTFNNAIYDAELKMSSMSEAQLKATSAMYTVMDKALSPALGFMGLRSPYSELSAYAGERAGIVHQQNTPLGQLRTAVSEGNTSALNKYFPTNAMDLSKYTEQEVAQAKLMSVAASQSELQALKAQAQALGLNKDEVEKVVQLRKDEIDAMTILITMQGKASYLTGQEANHLQEMLSEVKTQQKQEKSSFNFQRLSNVDSSQFPQLQALATMYNAMLSKMGSPEKNEHINLLLGDNTFKTMNVRMTALQLALEDLTKVEKAQLSGTWNLPAGATALVPITSLDLQRWNKENNGMPDLSALLGATNMSGDKVATSQQLAATRIIQAIQDSARRSGLPMDKIEKAKTIPEAVDYTREALLHQVAVAEGRKEMAENAMRQTLYGKEAQKEWRPPMTRQTTPFTDKFVVPQVQVSPLPFKAALTTTTNVVLNGSIIARAIVPYLFDQIVRMQAASGYRQQGVQR